VDFDFLSVLSTVADFEGLLGFFLAALWVWVPADNGAGRSDASIFVAGEMAAAAAIDDEEVFLFFCGCSLVVRDFAFSVLEGVHLMLLGLPVSIASDRARFLLFSIVPDFDCVCASVCSGAFDFVPFLFVDGDGSSKDRFRGNFESDLAFLATSILFAVAVRMLKEIVLAVDTDTEVLLLLLL
jgi:hypothetical protein